MKASDIIRDSCCGNLLNVDKAVLVKMVENLEDKVVFLDHQLNNAIAELQKRPKR